ncbi:MAG: GTPase ObgE [Clostridia bacterium]|nr:GTPase ObgE [Clostridia bacterium]
MDFLDKVRIVVKAGNGGDGCSHFHREKFVMKGGPSGGDGGNGGSVVFYADPRLNTLLPFRFQRFYRAENGGKGLIDMKRGKDGEDMLIHVPVGTVVKDRQTGAILADMSEPERKKTVLKGGHGGKGNARFATPTKQAPQFAQPGIKTEERELELELKTIADVGIIGLPSVGKSSILSVLTAARPKIAAYHFTTLTPNLGVAEHKGTSFVMADIPGLIEGAAEGAGLGHDFLRHIERTRLLIHVLDASGMEGRDPLEDFYKINSELIKFSPALGDLSQIVLANKMDIPEAQQNLPKIKAALEEEGYSVFPVSAATGEGFEEMLDMVIKLLDMLPPVLTFEETELDLGPRYEKGFTLKRADDGAFVLSGGDVDMLLDSTDPNNEVSMRRFQQLLIKTGMISALREAGCKEGDTIRLGEWEFDFIE